MLDINYIRANQSKVEDAIRNKGYGDEIDLGEILKLDDERKRLAAEADKLRHDRNEISAKMKNGKPDAALIEQGKELKKQLAEDILKVTLPIRERILEIQGDDEYLGRVVRQGAERARETAAKTLREVREIMGIKKF